METVIDPKDTALIVQCVQRSFLEAEGTVLAKIPQMLERKGTIPKLEKLVSEARRVGMPIVFVGHLKRQDMKDLVLPRLGDRFHLIHFCVEGTPGAEFVKGLEPTPDDHVVYKRRFSAFYCTDLDVRLKSLGVNTVIYTGLLTNSSIANSVAAANDRDLEIIVVSDCCACGDPVDDEFFMTRVFPYVARVRTAEEVLTALAGTGVR
ncbi:MAG: cysteine hydrolase [Chloroflexi bacterium]|nr:cysteine hydrolase [Chloroflexota bacterium]